VIPRVHKMLMHSAVKLASQDLAPHRGPRTWMARVSPMLYQTRDIAVPPFKPLLLT
jgi:hypothetical protein